MKFRKSYLLIIGFTLLFLSSPAFSQSSNSEADVQGINYTKYDDGEEIPVIIQFKQESQIEYNPKLDFIDDIYLTVAGPFGVSKQDIIRSKKQQHKSQIKEIHRKVSRNYNTQVKNSYTYIDNGIATNLTREQIEEARELEYVEKIYYDGKVNITTQEATQVIKADKTYNLKDQSGKNITGKGVEIAILDTGVAYNHSAFGQCTETKYLNNNCAKFTGYGYDFVNNDQTTFDNNGHGSHVAGTAAANGTFEGAAPDAQIANYKVLSSAGGGTFSGIIAGVDNATAEGADVISMSLGGGAPSDGPMYEPVNNAIDNGVTVVVAAGNSGPSENTIGHPGNVPGVVTVGATDDNKQLASFSSRGFAYWQNGSISSVKPSIVAPGVEINSSVPKGSCEDCSSDGYKRLSGTSMSTPLVSGSLALLIQDKPSLSPEQYKSKIMNPTENIGEAPWDQGTGFLNAYESVRMNYTLQKPLFLSKIDTQAPEQVINYNDTYTINQFVDNSINYGLSGSSSFNGFTVNSTVDNLLLQNKQQEEFNVSIELNNSKLPQGRTYGHVNVSPEQGINSTSKFVVLRGNKLLINNYLPGDSYTKLNGETVSTNKTLIEEGTNFELASRHESSPTDVKGFPNSMTAITQKINTEAGSKKVINLTGKGSNKVGYNVSRYKGFSIMGQITGENEYNLPTCNYRLNQTWCVYNAVTRYFWPNIALSDSSSLPSLTPVYFNDKTPENITQSYGYYRFLRNQDDVYIMSNTTYTYDDTPIQARTDKYNDWKEIEIKIRKSALKTMVYAYEKTKNHVDVGENFVDANNNVNPPTRLNRHELSNDLEYSYYIHNKSSFDRYDSVETVLNTKFLPPDVEHAQFGLAHNIRKTSNNNIPYPKYIFNDGDIEVGLRPNVWNGKFINTNTSVGLSINKELWEGYEYNPSYFQFQNFVSEHRRYDDYVNDTCQCSVQGSPTYNLSNQTSSIETGQLTNGEEPNEFNITGLEPGWYRFEGDYNANMIDGASGGVDVVATFNTSKKDKEPPKINYLYTLQGSSSENPLNHQYPLRIQWNASNVSKHNLYYRELGASTWNQLEISNNTEGYYSNISMLPTGTYSIKYNATDDSNNTLEYISRPGVKIPELNYLENIPPGKHAVLAENKSKKPTEFGFFDDRQIILGNNQYGNYSARIKVRFNQSNVSLKNSVINTDKKQAKSVIHNITSQNILRKDLLVPVVNNTDTVKVCPNATSITQVNESCSNSILLRTGQEKKGMYMYKRTFEDQPYYVIENITGTGATETDNTEESVSQSVNILGILEIGVQAKRQSNDSLDVTSVSDVSTVVNEVVAEKLSIGDSSPDINVSVTSPAAEELNVEERIASIATSGQTFTQTGQITQNTASNFSMNTMLTQITGLESSESSSFTFFRDLAADIDVGESTSATPGENIVYGMGREVYQLEKNNTHYIGYVNGETVVGNRDPDRFQLVDLRYNGSHASIVVDKQIEDVNYVGESLNQSNTDLVIGNSSHSISLDELKVYNKSLTENQIEKNYDSYTNEPTVTTAYTVARQLVQQNVVENAPYSSVTVVQPESVQAGINDTTSLVVMASRSVNSTQSVQDTTASLLQVNETRTGPITIQPNNPTPFLSADAVKQASTSITEDATIIPEYIRGPAEDVATQIDTQVNQLFDEVNLEQIPIIEEVQRKIDVYRSSFQKASLEPSTDIDIQAFTSILEGIPVLDSFLSNSHPEIQNVTLNIDNLSSTEADVYLNVYVIDKDGIGDVTEVSYKSNAVYNPESNQVRIDIADDLTQSGVVNVTDNYGSTDTYNISFTSTSNLYKQVDAYANNLSTQKVTKEDTVENTNSQRSIAVNISHDLKGGQAISGGNKETTLQPGQSTTLSSTITGDFIQETKQWHTSPDNYDTVDNQTIYQTLNASSKLTGTEWTNVSTGNTTAPQVFQPCDNCGGTGIGFMDSYSNLQQWKDTGDGINNVFVQDLSDVVLGQRTEWWNQYQYNNLTSEVEFKDIWATTTLDENNTETFNRPFIRIRANSTYNNTFTPGISSSCTTNSPSTTSYTLNGKTWEACVQDQDNTGTPEYFKLQIPELSTYQVRYGVQPAQPGPFIYRKGDPCPTDVSLDESVLSQSNIPSDSLVGKNNTYVCFRQEVRDKDEAVLLTKGVERQVGTAIVGITLLLALAAGIVLVFSREENIEDIQERF